MARYPAARWRPLPEATREPIVTVTQLVLHTVVGEGSPFGYFGRASVVVESHFWVGRHAVEQFIDTSRQADAQAAGNVRAISVETADNGRPDTDPWTEWQLDQLAALAAWAHRTHGIPLRQCQHLTDPGIGWHRQFTAWNPHAHSCPGRARIAQVPEVIRRAQRLVTPPPPPAKPAPKPVPAIPRPRPVPDWAHRDPAPAPATPAPAPVASPEEDPVPLLVRRYVVVDGKTIIEPSVFQIIGTPLPGLGVLRYVSRNLAQLNQWDVRNDRAGGLVAELPAHSPIWRLPRLDGLALPPLPGAPAA